MTEAANKAKKVSDGLLTAVQVSKAFNVSKGTVSAWVADGMPVAKRGAGRGSANYFDIEQVRAWKTKKTGKLDPQSERARKDKAQADNMEIRNKILLGDLIDLETVVNLHAEMVTNAKAKLLSLSTRIATVAIACESLEEIRNATEEIILEALSELARDPVPDQEGMDAPAGLDGESVGGPVQETQSGGISGAGAVEN